MALARKDLVKTSLDCWMHSEPRLCHIGYISGDWGERLTDICERSHPLLLVIEHLLHNACPLRGTDTRQKDLHPYFALPPEIHPHNSSPDLLICILLVLVLSNLWGISQAILSEVSLYLFFFRYTRWMISSIPKGFAFTTVHHHFETMRQ